jgi:hypothetical protein
MSVINEPGTKNFLNGPVYNNSYNFNLDWVISNLSSSISHKQCLGNQVIKLLANKLCISNNPCINNNCLHSRTNLLNSNNKLSYVCLIISCLLTCSHLSLRSSYYNCCSSTSLIFTTSPSNGNIHIFFRALQLKVSQELNMSPMRKLLQNMRKLEDKFKFLLPGK